MTDKADAAPSAESDPRKWCGALLGHVRGEEIECNLSKNHEGEHDHIFRHSGSSWASWLAYQKRLSLMTEQPDAAHDGQLGTCDESNIPLGAPSADAPATAPPITGAMIVELMDEHETNYVQKMERRWEWSCACGENQWFHEREFAVMMTRSHWADEIMKLLRASASPDTEALHERIAELERHDHVGWRGHEVLWELIERKPFPSDRKMASVGLSTSAVVRLRERAEAAESRSKELAIALSGMFTCTSNPQEYTRIRDAAFKVLQKFEDTCGSVLNLSADIRHH